MKLPFKLPFFNRRKKQTTVTKNVVVKDSMPDVTVVDEKEELLKKLNEQQLEMLFFRTGLSKDSISLQFVEKLSSSPTLLDYLVNNIFEKEIINKINANDLRVSDITHYKKGLFSYDIFVEEDKPLLDILRRETTVANKGYASFNFEEFVNNMNSDNYVDSYVSSLMDGVSLLVEKIKAIPLPKERFFLNDGIRIFMPLEANNVFKKDIFDLECYYSGDLALSEDTILFISYEQFLEWSKDEKKREILEKVQVVINEDYFYASNIKNNIRSFRENNNWQFLDSVTTDKLLIQVNHLLYLLDKSELDSELKEYYKYQLSRNYIAWMKSELKWGCYTYEDSLKELAKEIKTKLEEKDITKLTKEFNELNSDEKKKEVRPIKFSIEIFLKQIDNLDKITAFEFLKYVSALTEEERAEFFNNETVINKLRDLLKESSYDEYRGYEKICRTLSVSEIFKVFDAKFIKHFYKATRDQYQYRFFYSVMAVDINETVKYLLTNDEYFKEFINGMDKYSFGKLDYPLAVGILKKIEELNLNINFDFIRSFSEITQFKLLKEDFSNDFLVKIVESASRKVQQFFYLEDKRFSYLWEKFNILNLSSANYKFHDDVVNKPAFFDRFKGTSMVQFRANVNQFLTHQPDIYFEEKITKYEDELIANFDLESELFVQYKHLLEHIDLLDDRQFVNQGIDFFYDSDTNFECRKLNCIGYDENDRIYIRDKEKLTNYLKWLSKRKLNEVIVDRLFKDNIYNVFLNIKEMLRFNKGLSVGEKILSPEQVQFYETILNIDKLDTNVILEIYHKFKDKDIALMFYEDIQKLKYKSYDKIKEELFQPENMKGMEDKELSNKYGVPVFDLRDKNYVILARCLRTRHNELRHNRRDCYTLLSNENSSVMHDDDYIYGYSGFDNDCILHVSEGDSFSGDVKGSDLSAGSDFVNRIMTSHEIVTNSSWYSEVQIVNKKNTEKQGLFKTLRPSFLIVYDEINERILEDAKSKNIPICIISHSLNKEVIGDYSAFNVGDELRYTKEWGLANESERRKSR